MHTDELAEGAREGRGADYDALFARVAERVLIWIRCRLGPQLRERLDPVDVLQETYLRAHHSFPSFEPRGEGSFVAWFYRIADHTLRDLAAHHGAQKRRAAGGEARGSAVLDRLRVDAAGPATSCERREAHDRLVHAMDTLDPVEREALLLRFFEGLTLEQIGQRLSQSERSVRRLIGRAQARLGGVLEQGAPR